MNLCGRFEMLPVSIQEFIRHKYAKEGKPQPKGTDPVHLSASALNMKAALDNEAERMTNNIVDMYGNPVSSRD